MSLIPSWFGGRRSGSSVLDPFSLDHFDPFKDFPLSSSSSDFFRDNTAFVATRIDWKKTHKARVFKADLPGMRKEEVKVEIRVLQISGKRNVQKEDKNDKRNVQKEDKNDKRNVQKEDKNDKRNVQKEDKNDTWHRVERSNGKFQRRIRLPENVKVDQVKAQVQDGVLTVTVPRVKVKVKKPEVKAIDISG